MNNWTDEIAIANYIVLALPMLVTGYILLCCVPTDGLKADGKRILRACGIIAMSIGLSQSYWAAWRVYDHIYGYTDLFAHWSWLLTPLYIIPTMAGCNIMYVVYEKRCRHIPLVWKYGLIFIVCMRK